MGHFWHKACAISAVLSADSAPFPQKTSFPTGFIIIGTEVAFNES
jgi:hypothetical protein